jgi:hypothetical protein
MTRRNDEAKGVSAGAHGDASTAAEAGAAAEIHKPRRWHAWRTFLKEYAIVVLGVLTALVGDQIVDAMRKGHEAQATEKALQKEVGASLVSASERLMVEGCLTNRLAQLSQGLRHGDGRWRANPSPEPVGRVRGPQAYFAPRRLWTNASWQAVLASGGAAHLTQDRLRMFGVYYQYIDLLRDMNGREHSIVAEVQPLASDQSFSADKRVDLQADLAELDQLNFEISRASGQLLERAQRNGLVPDAARVEAGYGVEVKARGACVHKAVSTANALGPDAE